ncbi:Lipopolysaccharide export system protein LptA precursor [Candidatus Arsenophonus lipoptenae]|uniref:Lipopolysaccharide export system protein LptA n=2 Tax=Morganellaceae TaxID=1903414 RepID=A0A0X9VEH3_9GAMM|nr:Lipopolysaccharide export system protein LptA precursor [Candidatus Arsenophonus lipoptenae]
MLKLITKYQIIKKSKRNANNKIILLIKKYIKLMVISLILVLSSPTLALKYDTKQPIQINSVKQSLDLEKNVIIFTKNVFIKQGSLNIRADKVVVTRQKKNTKKIVIEAYGTPIFFYQLQNDDKLIKGHSNKIRYEMENEIIILKGNAYLKQLDNNITADKITYLIKTNKIEALSDKGNRVTTILLPYQLQEKILIQK